MNKATWKQVSEQMSLPPKQARIVELLLCGKQDKEIADEMVLAFSTVRTYLSRIFERTETQDRVALILHIFALAQITRLTPDELNGDDSNTDDNRTAD